MRATPIWQSHLVPCNTPTVPELRREVIFCGRVKWEGEKITRSVHVWQ